MIPRRGIPPFAAGLTVAMAFVSAVAGIASCDQGTQEASCAGIEIPATACPLLEDDSECTDPCCAVAYECVNGEWSVAHACAGYEPSKCPDGAPAVIAVNGSDAGVCDAGFPLPPGANGGTGCEDLQDTDCPVGEALACGSASCASLGCDALFYCVDGDWYFWGSCAEDGGLIPAREDAGLVASGDD